MVDHDVFAQVAGRGWRACARVAGDALPADALGVLIEDALYQHLREAGGLTDPRLNALRGDAQRFVGAYASETDVLAEALRRLVWARCLGMAIPRQVASPGGFGSVEEADSYCERALDAADLREAAARLLRHPEGRGLRRPARRRVPTAQLLDEDAPLGAAR